MDFDVIPSQNCPLGCVIGTNLKVTIFGKHSFSIWNMLRSESLNLLPDVS